MSENGKPLTNPQHEKFAQLIAKGIDKDVAYRKIHPDCSKASALSAGSRLLKIVQDRVTWIQEQTAGETVMDMKERREFMARVVRADLNNLDLEKDGDLLQEITEDTIGEAIVRKKIKLPGKRECVMDDAKLAGELIDKSEMKLVNAPTLADLLAAQKRMPELQGLS